jgi:hypothetical protein
MECGEFSWRRRGALGACNVMRERAEFWSWQGLLGRAKFPNKIDGKSRLHVFHRDHLFVLIQMGQSHFWIFLVFLGISCWTFESFCTFCVLLWAAGLIFEVSQLWRVDRSCRSCRSDQVELLQLQTDSIHRSDRWSCCILHSAPVWDHSTMVFLGPSWTILDRLRWLRFVQRRDACSADLWHVSYNIL